VPGFIEEERIFESPWQFPVALHNLHTVFKQNLQNLVLAYLRWKQPIQSSPKRPIGQSVAMITAPIVYVAISLNLLIFIPPYH